MFERNDKALLTTRIIIMVIIEILAVLSLVMGIVLAVLVHGAMFLIAFAGWFFCWLLWVFARLYLSYLCDIKLIRNKLYCESNKNLEVFLKAKSERSNSPEMQDKRKAINTELAHLQQLLNAGVITSEEYEKRKNELTKVN
ncbi:MAG: gas vesicle protein GvpG [Clostridia bacterium]|nr:gas vesicle protein GvpG [Clostridia bacterium]